MARQIYADNSATTQVAERAVAAMARSLREDYGNPSALYDRGTRAKKSVEDARKDVARALGAWSSEIYFTSGGTESDNWALRAAAMAKKGQGRHLIATAVEHRAVIETLRQLESEGFEVTLLAPDREGSVAPEALEKAIRPDTVLISAMLANNVVGTILPVKKLAAVARARKILFHADAVQAVGRVPIDVRDLGVDLLSLSAHKFHGPKGVGALYAKAPFNPPPLIRGGGQERGARSGTENVPGIVGLRESLLEALETMEETARRLALYAERIVEGIARIPGSYLTGSPSRRLPGHLSFVFDGIFHGALLINALNERGISASSGAACSAASKEGSHVLAAMGYSEKASLCALRLSLSRYNAEEDASEIVVAVAACVAELRRKKSFAY
ncbi:MAG: cysteine desulfurase [Deltaproteobacteria bacterium]|jgi:cysteine desulfurase|nr:cysteine desulfurase [Deltaproteobacteria bacterium]